MTNIVQRVGCERSLAIGIPDLPLRNYIHKESTDTLETLPVWIDRCSSHGNNTRWVRMVGNRRIRWRAISLIRAPRRRVLTHRASANARCVQIRGVLKGRENTPCPGLKGDGSEPFTFRQSRSYGARTPNVQHTATCLL